MKVEYYQCVERRWRSVLRFEAVARAKGLETDLRLAYARVSSRYQKEDLKRQVERLELYFAKGWNSEVIPVMHFETAIDDSYFWQPEETIIRIKVFKWS